LIQEPVQSAIWHCLNHYAYSDAIFLAERLFSETGTEECLHLVATCHYRAGNVNEAYHLLQTQGVHSSASKFLYAKCAIELEKDFEAENILNGNSLDPRRDVSLDDFHVEFGDKTSFALQLLSGIYERTERRNKAVELEKKALHLNPFLWSSFESLCNKGEFVSPEKIFDLEHVDNFSQCHGVNPLVNLVNSNLEENKDNTLDSHDNFIGAQLPKILQTPQQLFPATPQQQHATPQNHFNSTPHQLSQTVPSILVNDSSLRHSLMETPLLNCNSVSTPMSGIGPQISGMSLLNFTTDSDSSRTCGIMPPPLRPKLKRQRIIGGGSSPSFGTIAPSPGIAGGISARILEFSSPQIAVLSPADSPLKRKTSLTISPMPPPTRASTPSAPVLSDDSRNIKRVAMAAKPENHKHSVLGQSGNVITPQNTVPTRRSSRLFGSTQSVKENSKGLNKNRISTKSPSRKTKPRLPKGEKQLSELEKNEKNKSSLENKSMKEKILIDSESKPEKPVSCAKLSSSLNLVSEACKMQKSSGTGLMNLLRSLGMAYLESSRYNSREAIRLLDLVPEHHGRSSWALALIGKCHFELAEYRKAADIFRQLREQEPYRLDMMEYYSTALWHLQDDVELSALAQDLTQRNKLDAVSWCAAGNCFSHQKEHENAIRFFQRAVQVKPRFAYAYTLLGHEYVLIEELEKALAAFRTAVRIDSRHYNAWYGIGLTYFKQERFQLAEIYYRKALGINPFSPILMCHVAVVQHALQKTDRALQTLNAAIKIAPKNPLCKFERASILFSGERYAEALAELNELKDIVPKESPVYFLLGKVHNKLGNTHHALMHFSWAMDLDPKGANSQIKDALDPALNRAVQDSRLEEDMAGDEMESRNLNTTEPSGLTGDDSVFGENISVAGGAQPGTSMVLNESDDSL